MEIGKIEFAKYDAFTSTIEQARKERGLASPSKEAPPIPDCIPPAKSAEEMLKRVLEFAKQESLPDCEFTRGMNCAKRQMAAHLEMLIKEGREKAMSIYNAG